jgi:hypothetical protein
MNNIKYILTLLIVSSSIVAAQPALVAKKQCSKIYNINEIVFRVNANFPGRLKDCSAIVAKDVEATAANARLKRNFEKKDYKAFMRQCAADGMKKELPNDFIGANKFLWSLENFMQNILNSASSATGELDSKKLTSVLGGMSLDGFLNDVKKSLGPDDCVASAPLPAVAPPPTAAPPPAATPQSMQFVPPPPLPSVATAPQATVTSDATPAPKSNGYLGIRTGANFSHLYASSKILIKDTNNVTGVITSKEKTVDGTYKDVLGFQLGMVLDIVPINLLHIQPGFMYILKGTENNGESVSAHYIEIPLLLSLNVSIIRANVGPYLGIYLMSGNDNFFGQDFGLSFGLGVDIWKFYIGALYDYGFINMSSNKSIKVFNRTIGLNIGVNL